jgi:hypothetical protein
MKPKFVLVGNGTKLSMIELDLADEEEAMALAKRLADHTGRTGTLRMPEG